VSSLDQAKHAVQISCGQAQILTTAGERSGQWLTEYPLNRDHLHFLCGLVDCAPEGSQLKD